jgi:uncharacterized membrane protein YphA (DoxX/SURF4 family)
MKLAHASALYAAPIPLRLVLALTFIWAGLGKIIHEVPVQGEQAALLANMGYDFSNTTPATPDEETPDAEPTAESQDSSDAGEATPNPENQIATPPALLALALQDDTESAPADSDTNPTPDPQQAAPATPTYTAADFPDPVEVKSLYNLAILTYNAAHPTPDADGNTPPPIWPEWAARDDWPRYMAWAAAAVELLAGILIALGLLTRLSAFSLAGVMLTAAWLTELGPAIQSGDTLLGFLPNHDPWDINAWRPVLWQCSLFGAAVALTLTGPGAIALDRVPTDPDLDDDDDDDDDTE